MTKVIEVTANEVYYQTKGALIHDVFHGFKEDYLVIHSLLRKYNPKSILEIGTNIGSGVNVMARACPNADIYSLDLDYETMKTNSKQYPIGSKGEDRVGSAVTVSYTQLRGDSLGYDYDSLPYMEAWYIDGEHDYQHANIESLKAMYHKANLIIWHDSDMPPVWEGITNAISSSDNYQLFRVIDTRIAFAIRI